MCEFRLRLISASDQLRLEARAWDDLWQRSDVTSPAARAEMVALRVDHLAAGTNFRGLVVEHNGSMVAALPLVNRRLKRLLNVGSLPCNCWVAGGALLLDPSVDAAAALDCLVAQIAELPWPLLWLDQVPFNDPTWTAFRAACARASLSVSVREHYQIGQVPIGSDWQGYLHSMHGEHRRKINRLVRKLVEAGGSELRIFRTMSAAQVDELVRCGFEVEHRSWKAAEGTAVLNNPAIFEQYRKEAQLLTKLGHLELIFLEHCGQPIAFVYGWWAKGVHFFTKIGYDEAFARFAPGQQLTLKLLEMLHGESTERMIDFAGPFQDFHKVWTSQSYAVGPLVVATPHLLSRSLFHVYTKWQPRVRRLGQRVTGSLKGIRAAAAAAHAKLRRTLLNRPSLHHSACKNPEPKA